MPFLKVIGLPKRMPPEAFERLKQNIVKALAAVPATRVESEDDVTIHFPADRLKDRDGDDIFAKTENLTRPAWDHNTCRLTAQALGTTLRHMFPSSKRITTVAESLDPGIEKGCWSSGLDDQEVSTAAE